MKAFELPTAGHNRHVHQTTGMIIAQTKVNSDDALGRLVAHADATDSTVDQVAVEVLAGTITLQ